MGFSVGNGVLYFYRVEQKSITEDLMDAVYYWRHSQIHTGQRLFHQNVDMFIYADLLFLFIAQVSSIEINDFSKS